MNGNTSINKAVSYSIPTNAVVIGIIPNLYDNSAWCHVGISKVSNTGLTLGIRNFYSGSLTFNITLSISYKLNFR